MLKIKYLFWVVLLLFISSPQLVYAKAYHVPANYSTIQSAMMAASDGDTILVAPGLYKENINFLGKAVYLSSHFIYSNDTSYISNTVIDGNNSGSVITFNNHEDTTSVVSGFTITNGNASNGGGIYSAESGAKLLNLLITDNQSLACGGGIFCSSINLEANIILSNSTISQNRTKWGGGLYISEWIKINIVGTDFIKNEAVEDGGGICIHGWGVLGFSVFHIQNSKINGNFANDGAGMYIDGASDNFQIKNILFHNNIANVFGGGIYSSADLNLTNITSVDDFSRAGGFFYCIGSDVKIKNSIICSANPNNIVFSPNLNQGQMSIEYSIIRGNLKSINTSNGGSIANFSNNIDVNPNFVDSLLWDFHLSPLSPCIDAGNLSDDYSF